MPSNVLAFSGGKTDVYEKFVDYYNHSMSRIDKTRTYFFQDKRDDGSLISLDEKEAEMNDAFKTEIMRVAGIASFEGFPLQTWSNHPSLKFATFAVVSAMVDMVLPDALIQSTGLYADVRSIGFGDSASFEVAPRDLFVVSKGSLTKRAGEIQKQFNGQVTILPEFRSLSTEVALAKVLAGKESLALFVMKIAKSMEVALASDVYSTFNTAMAALDNAGDDLLRVAGYTQTDLVSLGQKVTSWNGGNKAMICGTQLALQNILPADANYRYTLESAYATLGYVQNFAGFDVMLLPQVADWATPFKTLLDDTKIYIISPGAQKLVKVVLEGSTLANTDAPYANANLSQSATIWKSWGTAICTNAVAAVLTL